MEILYQICLTLLTVFAGAILWAAMSAFSRPFLRVSFQTLSVLLTIFVIANYVWSDFTLGEITMFVLYNLIGWGALLVVIYFLITFVVLRNEYAEALQDIENLNKRVNRQGDDIEKLVQSVRKLGAPISREKMRIY